jgi:O-antigen/teichoic acid export membrane protein
LIRLAGRAEALVSVGAFALTWLTAGLATRFFAKTQGTEWMFIVYGLGLLANFNAETSTGVLQITDKIGVRGTVNFVQSVVSAAALVAVYLVNEQSGLASRTLLMAVLLSYLLGKTLLGIGLFVSARRELDRALGQHSGSRASVTLPPLRQLFGFAASSNLSATAILIFRESELLWIGLLLNSEAAGLYKIAYTIVSFLAIPADPLILAVFPETNRLIVQRNWQRLRGFLRQVTTISFAYNLLLSLGLALFGRLILSIFGSGYVPAYPALLALLVGLAFNYTLFWNRPVLLSFGLQVFALLAIAGAGLAKTILALALVPKYGFVMESLLLSGYYIVSVGLIVWRGMRELHAQESLDAAAIATK